MTRYMAINNETADGELTLKNAQEFLRTVRDGDWHIYEIGPEAKEPDYGPLVEWASGGGKGIHRPDCDRYNPQTDRTCDCGLTDALKAAGIS